MRVDVEMMLGFHLDQQFETMIPASTWQEVGSGRNVQAFLDLTVVSPSSTVVVQELSVCSIIVHQKNGELAAGDLDSMDDLNSLQYYDFLY